jgi:ubiquitin-conjugating enzyme E2 D/E
MVSQEKLNAMKRLRTEFDDLRDNPIANIGVSIGLVDEDSLFDWKYTLMGPRDTPYNGGLFNLIIHFPDNYPNEKPEVCFKTPIYHVNVNPMKNDESTESLGHVCINTLNWWNPGFSMREVINNIYALFYQGNPDSPYGIERALEFKNNRELFDKKVQYFTQKYASASRSGPDDYSKSWDFTYNP